MWCKTYNRPVLFHDMATIYFAGGCLWGTEHFMKQIHGVTDTQVGYANSVVENPSYSEVRTGNTKAVETVKVEYDPSIVGLDFLIKLFFLTIDPTISDRQGGDIGTQYRTGIYYTTEKQQETIMSVIDSMRSDYDAPIVTEVMPIDNFYTAEEYHQDYLDKNPDGYCHVDPRLFSFARDASRKDHRQ